MQIHFLIIALGAYMLAMGLLGYIRTGSPTALYVNGGFAIVTMILGYLTRNGNPTTYLVTMVWTSLITLMLGYLTFKRIAAHSQARKGSQYIFGSMALFALIVTIIMIAQRSQLISS